MTLPTIKHPSYTLELPVTKKEVEYRPYTVGEEKVLLTALQGDDPKEIETNIMNVVNACAFGKIDAINLPSSDFEYLFIAIRSKSVGNEIELRYRMNACPNSEREDQLCHEQLPVTVDLDKVVVNIDPSIKSDITIEGDIGVRLRYPTTKEANEASKLSTFLDRIEYLSKACIEMVYDSENVYSDFTEDDISSFYDDMTNSQKAKLTEFINSAPSAQFKTKLKCPKCDREEDIIVEGLEGFFG